MGTFTHEHTVRFHETDRAGIIYFSRVFEYCHFAFEEMLTRAVGDLDALFATGRWGMPLVHAEADYQRPIRLGERLSVELRVERLGERSVTFAYRVLGAGGEQRATAQLIHSTIDMQSFASIPLPGELREGLRALGLID